MFAAQAVQPRQVTAKDITSRTHEVRFGGNYKDRVLSDYLRWE